MLVLMGIQVEIVGNPPSGGSGLAVSNHLGYADIPVLGSILPVTFVSKKEVGRWPVIGLLSNIAGTVYVDRNNRGGAGEFVREARERISAGERVLVFPEGTSTRGDDILPFKSVPFAAVAGLSGCTVLPLHVDVVEIGGEPVVGSLRDAVSWHGDAAFVPHAFRMLGLRGIRYRVVIGSPIGCAGLDRKQLALAARESVGTLRKISAARRLPLPGGFIWVHPIP
jgi:1-acyl-sn-glycerol-3-phosphate acyltransferase